MLRPCGPGRRAGRIGARTSSRPSAAAWPGRTWSRRVLEKSKPRSWPPGPGPQARRPARSVRPPRCAGPRRPGWQRGTAGPAG